MEAARTENTQELADPNLQLTNKLPVRPLCAAEVTGGRRPSRSDWPLTAASTAACPSIGGQYWEPLDRWSNSAIEPNMQAA